MSPCLSQGRSRCQRVAATSGSCPNVPQPPPPGCCSSSCPIRVAPTVCQEVPECPANVGANLPMDLAFACYLGCPRRAWSNPGEGQGWWRGRGGQVFPYNGTSLCALRSYSPSPPPQFSLPWVTQLQLISLAHPGLYLGHGACCSEAVKESWLTRWRLGSPRGCTAGGERGTRDGDKGQDLDCPAPSGSACQVPFGAAGEPEQPDLHKRPDPVLPAARLSCPRRGRSAPALWLRGQPRSVQRHCQGAGMARSPLPAVGRLGHGYLAKVTAGAGLGEGPRCPDTCFHLLPAPPAGHRSTSPPWPAGTGSPPPGHPIL